MIAHNSARLDHYCMQETPIRSSPMTAFLDGILITGIDNSPELTVGKLIDRLQEQLRGTGQMIFTVACNREEIPPHHLDQFLAMPVSKVGRLDLITSRPETITMDALVQTRASLMDTFAHAKLSGSDLIRGKLEDGMIGLMDCVKVWADVHVAVTSGGALTNIDFDQVVIDGRDVRDCLNDIKIKLCEIKDAAESRDHLLLGKILRFDMDEALQIWLAMIESVIEQVQDFKVKPANIKSKLSRHHYILMW